jgi:AsmA protein
MKRWALGIGLFFLALLALVIILPFVIDLTHFKGRFLPQVEAALNRKVDVRKIRLSLFPLGARVEGVTVMDDPAFSSNPFLTVESTVVQLKFLPLLQRRIEVSEFNLKRPEMVLIKDSHGVMNSATLGKKPAGEKPSQNVPAPSPSEPAPRIGIQGEQVTVKGGKVTFIDRSAPALQPFIAEKLEIKVKNLILGKTPSFEASSHLLPADKLVNLKGEIGPLALPLKPEQIHLAANIGESDLDLRGGFHGNRAEMKAHAKMLNLDELMALLPASSSDQSQQQKEQKAPAPASPPSTARASLDFNFDKVVTKGIEITAVAGRAGLHRGLFSLDQFTASLFEGKLNGNARVNTGSATYPFTSDLSLLGVSFGTLVEKLLAAPSGIVTGKSDLSIALQGAGSDWSQLSRSLTGKGNLSVQNGGIEKLNLVTQTLELLHATGADLPKEPRTTFSELKSAVTVDHGQIRLPALKLAASDFTFLGEGTVGINGEFKMGGEMKLAAPLADRLRKGALAPLLGGKTGEAAIPIQLAGNTQGARLAVDESALKKEAAGKFTERLEKEKGAVLKKFFKR